MMENLNKRKVELIQIIKGWQTFDYDKETFSIKEDAPEEVKKAFEELQKMK